MEDHIKDLFKISEKLERFHKEYTEFSLSEFLDLLENKAAEIGKSWSGSWLGYHSCVYYKDFQIPPPGARFSQEWGLMDQTYIHETTGSWKEYNFDQVKDAIFSEIDIAKFEEANKISTKAQSLFEDCKEEIISIFIRILDDDEDSYLAKLKKDVESLKVLFSSDFIEAYQP